jgi:hypothetical protein
MESSSLLFLFIIILVVAVARAYYGAHNRYRTNWNSERKRQQQSEARSAWIQQCTYEMPQMICGSVPLGLDSDEQAVALLPDVDLLEPRAVRRSRSHHAAPTIRLAKGLSFRFGSSVSQSESFHELRTIDHGTGDHQTAGVHLSRSYSEPDCSGLMPGRCST